MNKLYRALWVEDGALEDLPELVGPVYMSGRYDLSIAVNVTDAMRLIATREFDAIVVDIRLPPGEDPAWIRLFSGKGNSSAGARLGIAFLQTCLGRVTKEVYVPKHQSWLDASRVGVMSVESESELAEVLTELQIRHFVQKGAAPSRSVLLDLLDAITMSKSE
ncbi:MAG TPA: hypothetical protein VFJ82_11540 [Longimicrobium sp.]|nr:hypothetical protein [Longimicrobium sp.]